MKDAYLILFWFSKWVDFCMCFSVFVLN